MGGRWSLLETTRRWRDSVHARCRSGALESSAVAYPAAGSGPSRILRREVGRRPPRILARFSSEPPKSASAERRGARVTSRPRSEDADVTDMLRHLMMLDEQTSQYRRQRDVIIERCLPLADHIARRFSNRGEPLEDSFRWRGWG
jgi:hypothetical protein